MNTPDPSSPPVKPRTTIEKGVMGTQIGVIFLWLVFLYPVLLWIVLGTLSSYGFQDKVIAAKKNINEKNLTIQMVIRNGEKLQKMETCETDLEKKLTVLRSRRKQSKDALTDNRSREDVWKVEWAALKDATVPKLIKLDQANQKPVKTYSTYADISYGLAAYPDAPEIMEYIPRYKSLFEKKSAVEIEKSELVSKSIAIDEEISNVKFELADIQGDIAAIANKEIIRDFVSELNYLDPLRFKLFATMPLQLLTLILTISMGALGSLILITLDYFVTGTTRLFSWYFFRPFLGMVTAFAVFILAKAGQLTISDASISQTAAENLNPYFISFLGIISGLLSEQATKKIRKTGQAILRIEPEEEKARYAFGLKEELEQQKLSFKELSLYIKADDTLLQQWLDELKPVPYEVQKTIAVRLNVPVRNLFTDIGPDQKMTNDSE